MPCFAYTRKHDRPQRTTAYFTVPLQDGFGQTWWTRGNAHTTSLCVSLRWSGLPVVRLTAGLWHWLLRWLDGLCIGWVVLVCFLFCFVFFGSTSFPWLEFFFVALLWGSWFTSIREDGCDKEAYQSYLENERNARGQPCQCCCRLWYPGEYFRLGTLDSNNSVKVREACVCLKLLSIYFDLCVDATGVVIRLVFSALISTP